jgi:2-aminoethylphosphonate-pyruvate transaminase
VSFVDLVGEVRQGLLKVAKVENKGYEAVIMQGAGTMGLESVITSIVPREGAKVAIFSTGSYGRRLAQIANVHDMDVAMFDHKEGTITTKDEVVGVLEKDDDITHVFMVHCETSVGTVNPVAEIGQAIKKLPSKAHGPRLFFVDSMSMFGAMDFAVDEAGIDAIVSSANKCIQGVPGFSFAVIRRAVLEEVSSKIKPRSLSLDLYDQWKVLEATRQFRFTPPTHVLLAFRQALRELEEETVAGRGKRYTELFQIIHSGFTELGFKCFFPEDKLPPHTDQFIITPWVEPESDKWDYTEFASKLSDRGMVVYPGKVADGKTFRTGHIGSLTPGDAHAFLAAVREVKAEMGF